MPKETSPKMETQGPTSRMFLKAKDNIEACGTLRNIHERVINRDSSGDLPYGRSCIFFDSPRIISLKNLIKNKLKEEYDIPTNLEGLNKWTLPKIEPSLIYKLGTFEKMGLKQIVKTTEETIPLNSKELTIRLLDESDLLAYKYSHKYMHIGLVQIAFKLLTLEGLPESFTAALRDGRNLNWKQSLM
ncbi:hypothetical protein QQ045_000979 [Rhodiola kirilowii]